MLKLLRKHWEVSVLCVLSILTIWPLLQSGYFSHHDDLQVIRIFEMRRCLADFQIPCRWAPDMGYGYGIPLFNFYNPLVYYIGAVLSFVLGFVWSAKALFIIALISGPIAMYFLGKELWGKFGGLVSTILFMFAPYRALDAYVRGALAELFAISLIPLIFLFTLRLIKQGKRSDFFALTVTVGIFLTTHNISVILWAPFIFLWTSYWLFKNRLVNVKLLLLSLLFGFGLSAFFTIPAYLEKDLVTSESLTTGDLDYHVHFASVRQLFLDRFWGYGASKLGPNDDLSMQIGWPHWWLVALGMVGMLLSFKGRSPPGPRPFRVGDFKGMNLLPLLLLGFFVVSVFMAHNKSTPVWVAVEILRYLQFPWRYLAVAVFSASLLGGFCVNALVGSPKFRGVKLKHPRGVIVGLIVLLSLILNWSYFRPEKLYLDVNDEKKLSGELWEKQQKGALLDYLPKTAMEPKGPAPDSPKVIEGNADVTRLIKRSNYFEFDVKSDSGSNVEVPVFNFPNWTIENGRWYTAESGNIVVEGAWLQVRGFFNNTSTRNFANLITLLSFGGLIVIWKYGKSRKIFG